MKKALIISCEHAGNTVPPEFTHLFSGHESELETHKGYDPGALSLAKSLRSNLEASFFYTEISRLLIEVNRSVGHPALFSKYTRDLDQREQEDLLHRYYYPYRDQLERAVNWHTGNGHQVFHLSIHTFTPELDGIKRTADVGLLFDPKRPTEKAFCDQLKLSLEGEGSGLLVKHNYPYKGTDDGLTKSLRKNFKDNEYCGIEIEVNQKFPQSKEPKVWENTIGFINQSICTAVRSFVDPGLVRMGRVA